MVFAIFSCQKTAFANLRAHQLLTARLISGLRNSSNVFGLALAAVVAILLPDTEIPSVKNYAHLTHKNWRKLKFLKKMSQDQQPCGDSYVIVKQAI